MVHIVKPVHSKPCLFPLPIYYRENPISFSYAVHCKVNLFTVFQMSFSELDNTFYDVYLYLEQSVLKMWLLPSKYWLILLMEYFMGNHSNLTLNLLLTTTPIFANSADPDQMASEEAI